jgi:FkbM family methyltransferase
MALLNLIKRLIDLSPKPHSDSWIIDGGCHHGHFSRHIITALEPSNVLSFEPDPDSFSKAKQNLNSIANVEIVNAALGSEKGRAEFFRGPYSATNSLQQRPESNLKPYYPEKAWLDGGTFVDVVTLDEECASRGITELDLLKLDLQGSELSALTGAKNLLGSGLVKVILTEAVFVRKYKDQPLLWELWRHLEGYGYTLYSLEQIKIGLYDTDEPGLRSQQWNQCDAIFISNTIREYLDK